MQALLVIAAALTACFVFWRYYFFFRDPVRVPPPGDHLIVAPADGHVVYVTRVMRGEIPVAVKQGRALPLTEIIAADLGESDGYLIGIFMNPLSVHRNRIPASGEVVLRVHRPAARNISMVGLLASMLLKREPLALGCRCLVENERLTIAIRTLSGAVLTVTQIADVWVNRIVARVAVGDAVERGQQYGLIRMGSQVDTFIPQSAVDRVLVVPGQRVRAGESVLAASPARASR
jgi:phosphatidylserine decarboxylase